MDNQEVNDLTNDQKGTKESHLNEESAPGFDDGFTGSPLWLKMYPCYQELPENRTIDGYPDLVDSNCNFCKEKCEKLTVNSDIGFFDGFDITESAIVSASILVFSIVYQVYICKYRNPKIEKEYQEIHSEQNRLNMLDRHNAYGSYQQVHSQNSSKITTDRHI